MRALSTKELLSCILIWMFLVPSKSWAQVEEGNRFSLSGIVKDESGNLLDNAHVSISETDMRMDTDHSGAFRFDVAAGTYTISVSKVGFSSEERQVKIKERNSVIEFVLSEAAYTHLEGATVVGKTALQEVRETAYNVTALDAKAFHNTTLDLAHLLNKSSGVKIRETGGMGSSYSINLNGFTGRHVKVFMDGVPMEGMGSSFQLNNIPINLAERIEIYKGVVPIELGADALGGAINVITNKRNKSYADISYSFGSFNTHKTNVNLGYGAKNGFTVQLNAFQNYSDNNYRVLTQNWNPEDRTFSNDSVWVKRFHDGYRNETIGIKTGFVNTDWADQLLFGITLGQERDDIQHSNLMKVVFGAKERKSNTIMPSLSYAKRDFLWEGMNVRVNAQYNRNYNQNIDTSAFEYDWYGTAFRQNDGKVGEANNTLAEFFNRNASVSLNSNYQINEQHSVAINEVWSTYRRNNADKNAL
ncbi:MAG TPA: TonB-dependent receptor, partial [Sphingobacterium sp.]|nr:TonB-dependent receptor [Sphingobacterium sp.]